MDRNPNLPQVGTQLKQELWNVINRYAKESDITYYECLGALEVCKQNLLDELFSNSKPE